MNGGAVFHACPSRQYNTAKLHCEKPQGLLCCCCRDPGAVNGRQKWILFQPQYWSLYRRAIFHRIPCLQGIVWKAPVISHLTPNKEDSSPTIVLVFINLWESEADRTESVLVPDQAGAPVQEDGGSATLDNS